ncbi:ubiquitin carboxyl-terminal hydrolase [Cladorrhinum sp. PSN259]|nr:ubiquitin carboxyl-terminal hydrolase [Cladorrhinum sp. PSN259]
MEEDAEPEVGDEGNAESKLGDEGNAELDSTTAVRRSGRARNAVLPFGDESNQSNRSGSRSNASLRSQKRKAASQTPQEVEGEAEEEQFDLPDSLLEAALAPWKDNELAQCPGWVELESEPQFLSEIMNAWGVTGAIVQELWSVDQEELSRLRRPVYGLVLLSKYTAKAPPETEKTDDLPWFANQTTSNACGTYALMNIVMNHEELSLGAKLKQVKEETKDLNSPQRGYVISKNTWLRSIHNSYARRLELMAESLVLQNQVDSDTERKRRPSPNKKTKTRKTGGGLAVHHFVGFVPVGNSVWYLDGMRKEGPVHLGKFDDGQDWTTLVEPVIQERAAKQAKSRAKNKHHLSLVAVCASENPVERIRAKLATNIRCLHDIQVKWGTDADFIGPRKQILETVNQDTMIFWEKADDLQNYQLSKAEIDYLASPEAVVEAHQVDSGKAAGEMWTNLCVDQIVLREEYQKAVQDSYEEAQRKAEKSSRVDDLTPFIHEFIKQLDKHYPALEELYMEAEQEEESRKARTVN